ncbi:MAG: MFS transporter [Actinomycetota bacterium]|nr:MFS transporter [Actinomycetota bacterium]
MDVYLRILRVPRVGRLLAANLLARLPIGINGLAIILFLRAQTGSFAVAGLVAGALALGSGSGAPLQARLVDRHGRRVLVPLALAHAAGLLALLALGTLGAPSLLLALTALGAGLVLPPISSVMRARYPALLRADPALVRSAFALDSVLTETIFTLGPLLTAVLVATLEPQAALVLSAGAVVCGTVAFVTGLPPAPGGGEGRRSATGDALGALRSPAIRTLVLATLPIGFAFGAIEVALPAFATEQDRPELAGVLLAVWSLGSLVGGLVYGARARSGPLPRVHLRLAVLVAVGFLPLLLAPSFAVMALLVIPAGVFVAPLIATRNELAGTAAPAGAETEALTWPLTALVSGIALGAAVGGSLADGVGWRGAVVAGVLAAALGATVAVLGRARLGRAEAPPVLSS